MFICDFTIFHHDFHSFKYSRNFKLMYFCWILLVVVLCMTSTATSSNDNVKLLIAQLEEAVKCMVNAVNPQQQAAAIQFVEDFKENSPDLVRCAFDLLNKGCGDAEQIQLSHFALMLLQHFIEHRWPASSDEEKTLIKTSIIAFMEKCCSTEAAGGGEINIVILEHISRTIVCIVRRDWPFRWPQLMPQLKAAANSSRSALKIFILTIQRISEDVDQLEDQVPSARRRQLRVSLQDELINNRLFDDLVVMLERSLHDEAICSLMLKCLATLVVWLPLSNIVVADAKLLRLLYSLLGQPAYQFLSVACLSGIINHHSSSNADHRSLLLIFLDAEPMNVIRSCIATAVQTNEWAFTTELVRLLIGLGNTISATWPKEAMQSRLGSFPPYLEFLIDITAHPNQILSEMAIELWLKYLKQEQLRPKLEPCIASLLLTLKDKMSRVGFPSKSNHPSCDFNKLEFVTDEDFEAFFNRYKTQVFFCCGLTAKYFQTIAFDTLYGVVMAQPIPPIEADEEENFIKLDSITSFVSCLSKKIPPSESLTGRFEEMLRLILSRHVAECRTRRRISELFLKQCVLLSAHTKNIELLERIVNETFQSLCSVRQSKDTISDWRTLHCNLIGLLIELAKVHGGVLLPVVKDLSDAALVQYIPSEGSNSSDQLLLVEYCLVCEAILLILNHSNDFEQILSYIVKFTQPLAQLIQSDEIKSALVDCQSFVRYLGLDSSTFNNKTVKMDYVKFLVRLPCAILKRIAIVNIDVDRRRRLYELLVPFIDSLLRVCRFTSQIIEQPDRFLSKELHSSVDIPDAERRLLIGVRVEKKEKSNKSSQITNLSTFFSYIIDTVFMAVADLPIVFTELFYSRNGCVSIMNFIATLSDNLMTSSMYYLKRLVRHIHTSIVVNCPTNSAFAEFVVPILVPFCSRMHDRIAKEWRKIDEFDDEENEEEEIIQSECTRQITREYLMFLSNILIPKKQANSNNSPSPAPSTNAEEVESTHSDNRNASDQLSDFGKIALSNHLLATSIISTILSSLSWPDSQTCRKSIDMCFRSIVFLSQSSIIGEGDLPLLFDHILAGLAVCGQFESCVRPLKSLLIQFYEAAVISCVEVRHLLQTRCQASNDDMNQIDSVIDLPSNSEKSTKKTKQEWFGRVLKPLIGKPLSQQFNREPIVIKACPEFDEFKRCKQVDALENGNLTDLFNAS